MSSEAFYLPLDEGRYLATEHTQGPWDPSMQHLGPVTALVVHELELAEPRPDLELARLVVEILAPVPVAELSVGTGLVRDGKRVQCLTASVSSGGREFVRVTTWRVRSEPTAATPAPEPPAPLPPAETHPASWLTSTFGYGRAMDWRFTSGSPDELGPATAWVSPRVALVQGREPTPVERLATVTDSGSGISFALDFDSHLFANIDLTISLFRAPRGEWTCLGSATVIGPAGRGLTRTTLYDAAGEVGTVTQTLFVGPR